jgi:LTXXQ motif family protein
MKPKLVRILAMAIAIGALTLATDVSWGKGGGGHGGGGHGGGHGGGGHAGGHGGAHFGGGHGGRHFGGGHAGGHHFAGGHHGGAHVSERHFGRSSRFAGGHQLGGRNHFNHNAFGNRHEWNHFARMGGAGWGGWGGGWGGWGGWVGPVFWPFLLGDVLSCAFWPYAYCYPFWSYGTAFAYDYGPYVPAYGYGGTSNVYGYAESSGDSRRPARSNPIAADVTQSCGGFAPGVTSFPIDKIRREIHPTGEALVAVDQLADASSQASNILSASCPREPPLTPLARLDAVETRLEAMIKAIQIVRPPLASLYDSLSDEQTQRLEAIGVEENRHGRATAAADTSGADTLASLCGSQAESFTKLPVERIEEIVKPTGSQQAALDQLKQASAKAADALRSSCPAQAGETPTARLDAMNHRLDAMVQAVKALRPTLGTFYASLGDEQKAQFNAMGQRSATPQENATGGRQE